MGSSCTRPSSSHLYAICFNSSTNNTEDCKVLEMLILILKVDCYINQIFYPLTAILIVIGTILNLFSLYCFRKMNKRSSQNVYLFVLSLGDTIGLHINFTLPMLRQNGKFDDAFRNSKYLCRLTGVFTEFFLIFPTWIVVLLTIERLICTSWPLKRRSLYTQTRAKISIIILAIFVLAISLYRLVDLKGIDQVSVFSVVACNGTHRSIGFMRNLNLMIWTLLPECFTLIMSLIIVYQIKLATKKFEPTYSKAHQLKYNQATKTVLLISILFLFFHTPTGLMIALNLFYANHERAMATIIILVSRKLTITLYEINLCCKFFIYNQTFRNFRVIFHTSIFRFAHRTNSAKLGRPVVEKLHTSRKYTAVHFGPRNQSITSPVSQSDSYTKIVDEHHNRHPRSSLTNLSRTNREYQPLTAVKIKSNEDAHASLQKTPNLLRSYSTKRRRQCWHSKPQITF